MTVTRSKKRIVAPALAVVFTGGLALLRRRRRTSPGRRPDEGNGGTAGVREPRRPIPPTLVTAGVAEPLE